MSATTEPNEAGPPSIIAGDPATQAPIQLFRTWLEEAAKSGLREPSAMSVATVGEKGRPSVRMLLLKAVDDRGFVFYTNLESPKAHDLRHNPWAALCFYWMPLGRQVRVEGPVEPVSDAEADAYFASRPRLSQIGAWASHQSQPMSSFYQLEQNVLTTSARFGFGKVPRPPFWSGFRVLPETIEFWKEKPFRRHERILYTRSGQDWTSQWIFP
jgi:pyridoxamine 5'-phosphate oxidase